ncbi:MAG: ubiquitin-like domain-containing protein, partial [Bacillota bacterium]|nr:ubiquitin-like domain-containing protein [Bacillota bacterium]
MEDRKRSLSLILIASLSIMLVIGIMGTYIFEEKVVNIYVDGEVRQVLTHKVTVKQLLEEQEIELADTDILMQKQNSWLQDEMDVNIIRGAKTILMVDGEIREIMVPVPDVKQVLLQQGVELGPNDWVEANFWPQGDIDENFIKVTRIREMTIIEEEEIDYPIVRQPDYRLLEGQERVIDTGEPGLLQRLVELKYEDGVETSRNIMWEEQIHEPKPELVVYGAGKPVQVAASRGSYYNLQEEELRQVLTEATKVMNMEATAYTHTGNPTFTGIMPYVGVIAVDPKTIPLGAKVYV